MPVRKPPKGHRPVASRREFLAIGGAALAGLLTGRSVNVAQDVGVLPPPSPKGTIFMWRLSFRGRRASRAEKSHAANLRFGLREAALLYPAHPGSHPRVVPIPVSREDYTRLFLERRSLVADLRDLERIHAPYFKRADVNGDGVINIGDPIALLDHMFIGQAPRPTCLDAADTNDDGTLDVGDAIASLWWQFLGGSPPPSPGPFRCGTDATPGDRLPPCVYPPGRCAD